MSGAAVHGFTCTECDEAFDAPEQLGTHLERHRECPPAETTRRGKPLTRLCAKGCGRNVPLSGGSKPRGGWGQHEQLCDGRPPLARRKGAEPKMCLSCGFHHLSSEPCKITKPAPRSEDFDTTPNTTRPMCPTCFHRHAVGRCQAEIPEATPVRSPAIPQPSAPDVPERTDMDSEEATKAMAQWKCGCGREFKLAAHLARHKGACDGRPKVDGDAAPRQKRAIRVPKDPRPRKRVGTALAKLGTSTTNGHSAADLEAQAAELRAKADRLDAAAKKLKAIEVEIEEALA